MLKLISRHFVFSNSVYSIEHVVYGLTITNDKLGITFSDDLLLRINLNYLKILIKRLLLITSLLRYAELLISQGNDQFENISASCPSPIL